MSNLTEKHRPTLRKELLGQPNADLVLDLAADYVSPAYLFYGPPGTGKTSTAQLLAMEIEASSGGEGHIGRWNEWDFVLHNCGLKGGVDDAKDLITGKCAKPPTKLKKKYIVLDECHMLTPQAQNALLNIMEDPPGFLVFLLCTTDVRKLLPAVKSRCMLVKFLPGSDRDISDNLARVCVEEGIEHDQEGLYILAKASRGSFRESLTLLAQVQKVGATGKAVSAYSGYAGPAQVDLLLSSAVRRDIATLGAGLEAVRSSNINPVEVLRLMLDRMIDMAKRKSYTGTDESDLFTACQDASVIGVCDVLQSALSDHNPATDENLLLEYTMLKIAQGALRSKK